MILTKITDSAASKRLQQPTPVCVGREKRGEGRKRVHLSPTPTL